MAPTAFLLKKSLALPAWNNDAERQEIRKLYAEARTRMVTRRDEAR
jgi:hypothetical protein